MSQTPDWIAAHAARALNPGQVEGTLRRLSENWPADARPLRNVVEEFPLGASALLHLISVSSICGARLIREPGILLWLQDPDVCADRRSRRRMLRDLAALTDGPLAAQNFRALRLWKGREMLRIALREVAEAADLQETTVELSQLAEICVAKVLEHWDAELRRKFGAPTSDFAILGLGKLGGQELNHSSDIDVIFLYSEDAQITPSLTNHQWFNRLAAKIVETFSATDPAGALFRMDLRLRPEGSAGPMARSLASLENYYAGFGETWERLALIKARYIAGSAEVAYDFLREHQPFIYPKSPTAELLDEVANIKLRIERDIVGYENLERDVKLGTGGIREIEFVVQTQQLLHGARHAFLQETSTLKALPALAELELLPRAEVLDLEKAYRFLRRVEHRLQIEAEQQTHIIPEDSDSVMRLALSLGFAGPENFWEEVGGHTMRVREIFTRVIAARPQDKEAPALRLEIFADQQGATKTLAELAHGRGSFHIAPRTKQIFRKLRPPLLEALAQCVDPDVSLTQFLRFVEAYGMRSLLFELLVTNPRLLELLIKTIDASRYASDLLIRRPQLLEEVTRPGVLDRSVSVERHLNALRATAETIDQFDEVRAYRQGQSLRILVRDVLGAADLLTLQREHSAIAEACLLFVHQLVAADDELTIVAMGKFGGRELSYGADLDVLFVGGTVRRAQEIVVEMAKSTPHGGISPVDARLRPDGEKGPLTASLVAYERYYRTRAQLWELQALTRARVVCGPLGEQFLDLAKSAWKAAGQRPDLFHQIDAMRERIRRDRGSGSDGRDFKTGPGGMVEAEFLVQALQMKTGTWNPHFSGALDDLKQAGALSREEAIGLQSSYDFLRRCESILRRWDNKGVASLPVEEGEQRKLSRRLGAKNMTVFGEQYRFAREAIHAIYSRHIR